MNFTTGSIADAQTARSWNGPTCVTCGRGYIDYHVCALDDLYRRIADLQAIVQQREQEACNCKNADGSPTLEFCPVHPFQAHVDKLARRRTADEQIAILRRAAEGATEGSP